MGFSVDAYLFYGVFLCDNDEGLGKFFPDADEEFLEKLYRDGLDEIWLEAQGVVYPEHDSSKQKKYYEEKRALERECRVDTRSFGHYDYEGWLLVHKDFQLNAEFDRAVVVDPSELLTYPTKEWDEHFRKYFEVIKIPFIQPTFLLAASYG